MGLRIGLPRALWYYSHFPFWKTFWESLGAQVVVSKPTSRETLNSGVEETVSEACVPIKLFFGHVKSLVEQWEHQEVDALFIPRYVNWHGKTVYCPKFLGLPDMVRSSFSSLPPLLEARIDRRKSPWALFAACNSLRKQIGASLGSFLRAYHRSVLRQREHEKRLRAGWSPQESIAGRRTPHKSNGLDQPPVRLALLGYPYLLSDKYMNLSLVEKLQGLGVQVYTAETVRTSDLKGQNRKFIKKLFWTYSDLVAKAGFHFLQQPYIDGLIHVTAFGCGPDAMVDKLLELRSSAAGRPYLPLCLDEHTGEAGIITRLEAFIDMLKRRRQMDA